jgi:hypothetical protein
LPLNIIYNNSKKSLSVSLKALQPSKQANSVKIAKALYYVGDCYENSKR